MKKMAEKLNNNQLSDYDGNLDLGIRESEAVERSILQSNDDALLIIENVTQLLKH